MKRLAIVVFMGFSMYLPAETLSTLDGHVYRNARITRQSPVGLNIVHSTGSSFLAFTNLPQSVRMAYAYDPGMAEAHLQDQARIAAARRMAQTRQQEAEIARRASAYAARRNWRAENPAQKPVPVATPVVATSRQRDYSSVNYSSRRYGSGRVHVRGYYRKDGTYVRSHTRSR